MMGDLVGQFQEPLGLLLRWGHILAAVVALGGLFFSRFALLPALDDLDEAARQRVHDGVRRSWLMWVIGAITILLVTGLVNYLLTISRAGSEAWGGDGRAWMRYHKYHALMGAKILFAFALFYVASAIVGRGEGSRWARDDRRKSLGIALGLGLAVVIISGYLRQMHTGPNVVARDDGGARMGGAGDEGTPEPGADDSPAAPRPPSDPVRPPDEGEPEPGADAPAPSSEPAPAGA
ncbi:MAG: hypothetical protein ACKO5R_05105 [Planctomycetaceae bacterium]